jgi:hypothetical protein
MKTIPSLRGLCLSAAVALSVVFAPSLASAAGGGSNTNKTVKTYEARVTGYVTAIDYVNGTITVGASYYGSGMLKVSTSTNISMDNVSCDFADIALGDWMEARYDWVSKTATKLSGISVATP